MSFKKSFFVITFSLIFAFVSYYVYSQKEDPSGVVEGFSIVAPIPNILVNALYNPSEKNNYWKPSETLYNGSSQKPDVQAVAALTYDLSNERLLYSSNIKERLPLASLTKIMTAIVALENTSPNSDITVSNRAATIGENSMGLTGGETLTLKELLYGLFLNSGNDAAEAIAEGSSFGRNNFVYQMNKKAEDLGLTNTRFTNPSGLEGDGEQYSTAYDLLVMTRYGLQNPIFAEVSSTVEKTLPYSERHKEFYLFNETNLLTSYPGVKGVKTGFTNEAGMCLVTYLEYEGHKIIGVILNSPSRREEMKKLLNFSLSTQGVKPPPHP